MGLKRHDLRHLVDPHFSIDRFEPETGEDSEVAVIAFRVGTYEAAGDLASFIEKGVVPGILDAVPSPGCDPDGKYRVFVEIKRNLDTPKNVLLLIKDICNIVPVESGWSFEIYGDYRKYKLDADSIVDAFITSKNGRMRVRPPAKAGDRKVLGF